MVAITHEMVEQRLVELRAEQIKRLSESSALLGRIQECEMLLIVLGKPEGSEAPPNLEVVDREE